MKRLLRLRSGFILSRILICHFNILQLLAGKINSSEWCFVKNFCLAISKIFSKKWLCSLKVIGNNWGQNIWAFVGQNYEIPFKKWRYPLDIAPPPCTARSFLEDIRLQKKCDCKQYKVPSFALFNFQTQRVLSEKGNLELKTCPGLLFHQHYPPKNTNINVN